LIGHPAFRKPVVGQVRIAELFEKTPRDVGTPVQTRHRGVRLSAISLEEGYHFFIALPIGFGQRRAACVDLAVRIGPAFEQHLCHRVLPVPGALIKRHPPTERDPIVIFHGNGQTGTDWLQTPDGRAGWAYYLVKQGYVVYMVDYPARGRSVAVLERHRRIGQETTSRNSGVIHAGECISASRAMAAISSALSASDEKNCAAMMV